MILHATKAGVKKVTNECNAVRHGMEVNAIVSNAKTGGERTCQIGEVSSRLTFGSPFAFGSHDTPGRGEKVGCCCPETDERKPYPN